MQVFHTEFHTTEKILQAWYSMQRPNYKNTHTPSFEFNSLKVKVDDQLGCPLKKQQQGGLLEYLISLLSFLNLNV